MQLENDLFLIQTGAGLFDDPLPSLHLLDNESLKLLRRHVRRLHTRSDKSALHIVLLYSYFGCLIQSRDDLFGRSSRRQYAKPSW